MRLVRTARLLSWIGRQARRLGTPLAWVETVIGTLLAPLVGFWINREDPFFFEAAFPWLILAPLVLGLRYGFVHGFTSALGLNLILVLAWMQHWMAWPEFPAEFSIGVMIVGMLSGEFVDMRMRHVHRLEGTSAYQRLRLDEFARAYHLLSESHHRLELRLVGSGMSLREALLSMRRRLQQAKRAEGPLYGLGEEILGVFADHGWIQAAALFVVQDQGTILNPPVAAFGRAGKGAPPSPDDPLLVEALRTATVVTIRMGQEAEAGAETNLLAAVSLVDVSGRLWAVLAVQDMLFVAFHSENLKFLAVLGGHVADLLASGVPAIEKIDESEAEFVWDLRRTLDEVRRYDLPAMILAVEFTNEARSEELGEMIVSNRRGLDRVWRVQGQAGLAAAIVLMPLTDELAMEGYRARMEKLVRERLGLSLTEAGAMAHPIRLRKHDGIEEVLAHLRRVCRLDRG